MVAADALRAMVILSVPAAAAAGSPSLRHLWAAVFINACPGTFFDVSIAAYVPPLVGHEQLLAANARLEASRSAAQVIGPTAAGLIAALSAPFALLIDGVSFLASSLLLASSRGGEHREHQVSGGAMRRRDEILAGARFAIRRG